MNAVCVMLLQNGSAMTKPSYVIRASPLHDRSRGSSAYGHGSGVSRWRKFLILRDTSHEVKIYKNNWKRFRSLFALLYWPG